jgi:hypothetical protein
MTEAEEERFPEPSALGDLRAVVPLTVREGFTVELPALVRWALSLNEGSLLTAEIREMPERLPASFVFRNYEASVRGIVEAIHPPWPWILELLKQPMGRMVAGGGLELPEAVVDWLRLKPGDRLVLRANFGTDRAIRLERDDTGRVTPELSARAGFPGLRVEEGGLVEPPREVLRLLPDITGPLRVEPSMLRDCKRVHLDVYFVDERWELSWSPYPENGPVLPPFPTFDSGGALVDLDDTWEVEPREPKK